MAHVPSTSRLEARVSPEIHSLLKRAAEMQGRTLSDFVVTAAREAASQAIEQAEVLRLSSEDQKRLASALLKPPAPAAALRRAAKRRQTLLGR